MSRYEDERNERNEGNEHGVTTGTTVGAPVIDMGVTTGTTGVTPTTTTVPVAAPVPFAPVGTNERNERYENERYENERYENERYEGSEYGTAPATPAAPVIDMGVTTGTTGVTPTTTTAPVAAPVPFASVGTTVLAGRETFRFGVDRENHVTEASELDEHGSVTATTTATSATGVGAFTAASAGREVNEVREMNHGRTTFHYSDDDSDGLYVRDYEEWAPSTGTTPAAGGALPVLSKLTYVATTGNDDVAVRNGLVASGGVGTDRFVVREASHMKIGDFHKGESDKLVFDTGLGLQSKAQLASYVTSTEYTGGDFIIHFGDTASVTLVGVNPATVSWDDVTVLS